MGCTFYIEKQRAIRSISSLVSAVLTVSQIDPESTGVAFGCTGDTSPFPRDCIQSETKADLSPFREETSYRRVTRLPLKPARRHRRLYRTSTAAFGEILTSDRRDEGLSENSPFWRIRKMRLAGFQKEGGGF